MSITRYYDQLVALASSIEGKTDRVLLRAFEAAGIPSSTFYRARLGTDLQGATAERVAVVLRAWRDADGRVPDRTLSEAAH